MSLQWTLHKLFLILLPTPPPPLSVPIPPPSLSSLPLPFIKKSLPFPGQKYCFLVTIPLSLFFGRLCRLLTMATPSLIPEQMTRRLSLLLLLSNQRPWIRSQGSQLLINLLAWRFLSNSSIRPLPYRHTNNYSIFTYVCVRVSSSLCFSFSRQRRSQSWIRERVQTLAGHQIAPLLFSRLFHRRLLRGLNHPRIAINLFPVFITRLFEYFKPLLTRIWLRKGPKEGVSRFISTDLNQISPFS